MSTYKKFFFKLTDLKQNFMNNPAVHLFNPAKNELGCISEIILDKINSILCKN